MWCCFYFGWYLCKDTTSLFIFHIRFNRLFKRSNKDHSKALNYNSNSLMLNNVNDCLKGKSFGQSFFVSQLDLKQFEYQRAAKKTLVMIKI